MARALTLGNGRLTVNFDSRLVLRELYFPHVGMFSHVEGRRNMIGVWEGGRFAWIDADSWNRSIRYREDTMVSECRAVNPGLGVELSITDCVHYRENIFLRRITARNASAAARQVRLFFVNDLCINESDIGDTAYYDPDSGSIVHHKRGRFFCFGGRAHGGGFSQFTVGKKRFGGAEGTWRDAEDGCLEGHSVSHGSVDSTVSFWLDLGPYVEATVHYWMCVADGAAEAMRLNALVTSTGADDLIEETATYWKRWLARAPLKRSDLSDGAAACYRRSLLLTRAALDHGGGVLASTDLDIMMTNRDHYSYVWPRDAALAARSLALAGYPECSRAFLQYAARTVTDRGFFWPKYHADGTVGSSWHPREGPFLPVQEDETGLVAFLAGEHLRLFGDVEFLSRVYSDLVKRIGVFLSEYRDDRAGLPLPSHDLWEERRGVFIWTCSAVYAGLKAAGDLASVFEPAVAARFYQAAAEVGRAVRSNLYSPRAGRFVRGFLLESDGSCRIDHTIESSAYGVVLMGVLNPLSDESIATMNAIRESLWIKTGVGGVCRYPNDWYFRVTHDPSTPGNPWFVCSLWLASWHIAAARSLDDLEFPRTVLEWAPAHALETGIMSEQLHPFSGEPLSVAPLTWSHSTYVNAFLDYEAKWLKLST
ncbi:MAG: glycoside hydrolase family 15 protein [Firmicutes bacterium]|nr:glycoside hydrolase family 15 protein [Bacillota bacterium]